VKKSVCKLMQDDSAASFLRGDGLGDGVFCT